MLSEGFIVSLSLRDASPATRPESFSLGRTLTDWLMYPSLDTPIFQRLLAIAYRQRRLTRLDQLQAIFGIFAITFAVKSRVSIVVL